MTRGNPAKLIVLFALPLMVGNVFQQLYTMTDAIIVGQFAGVQALGAVGSTDWLSWLVFGLISGVMQGFSIPVAQRFGAGDLRGLRRCVSTLLVLAAVLAVGFTVLGLIFAGPLLRLIGTQQVLTNYSTGACKARIAQFTQLKALIEAQGAGDTTAWLDQGLQAAQESMGKGFVEESLAPAQLDIAAAPAGQRVFLLTSGHTADAAEWLASVAKKSTRAKQVGQATRGTLDYSNPVTLAFGDRFVFTYPMTKTVEAAQGKGIRGTGLTPDIACQADEALKKALEA